MKIDPKIDLINFTVETTDTGLYYTNDNIKLYKEDDSEKYLVYLKPLGNEINNYLPVKYIDNSFDLVLLLYEFNYQNPYENLVAISLQDEMFSKLKDRYENYRYLIYNKKLNKFLLSNDDSLDYIDIFDYNQKSLNQKMWEKGEIEIIDIKDQPEIKILTTSGWKHIEEEPIRKKICNMFLEK